MSAAHSGADLAVGDTMTLHHGPVDRTQLVRYAGASGDFNRIHYEEPFAQAAGYPSVIAHGMLSMALLGRLLTDRFGPTAVRALRVRFKAVTFPGDTVTCTGVVTALGDSGGARVAELRLTATTEPGKTTIEGTATVAIA